MVGAAAAARSENPSPENPQVRRFSNITAGTLACLADRSRRQHGTVDTVDGHNPDIVTSETHYFGLTRIARDFDPQTRTATYTILRKPGFASYDQVWNGIRDAIRACS